MTADGGIHGARLTAGALVALLGTAATLSSLPQPVEAGGRHVESMRVYFGTYSDAGSRGIYHSTLRMADGSLSPPQLAAESAHPSFLALHPSGRFLYAVNETTEFRGRPAGAVSAFRIDPATGSLTLLNQETSGGGAPCHLVVDAAGKHVLVANYVGGSVSVIPIREDGSLGPPTDFHQHRGSSVDPRRQEGPHGHSINLDRADRFAFAADLGLDQILVYRYDAARGKLTPNDPPFASIEPGGGPRHFAIHPNQRFAFTNHEMTSKVTAFSLDAARGVLKPLQTLPTLPEPVRGNSTAEIQVHPGGKALYVSNRGHNSIAVFRLDDRTGRMTAAGHQPTGGRIPRNFGIDPTGTYLLAANQDSGDVTVFRIDAATGELHPTTHRIAVPRPVCVKFLPLR